MKELISVIIPLYNSEHLIKETLASVLSQTYQNIEVLVVDDCSTDSSYAIVEELAKKDNRIKLFKNEVNSGAAVSRNVGLKNSTGRYIAYVDADDLWKEDKLEKQIKFLKENKIGFSCCGYNVINENGVDQNKEIFMPNKVTYKKFLRNTILQTVGIIVDTNIVDKSLLVMPLVRRGQDAATWAQILKKGHICYGQHEVLASYRKVKNSLSSNKFKAVKRTWHWYRKIEKLNIFYASYCFIGYALNAAKKRLYIRKK